MPTWILDTCPDDRPCEIVTVGGAGGAFVTFTRRCAFHTNERPTFLSDGEHYDAIVGANRAREAARWAAKQSLKLDKEHPGVWYRNEPDGSFTLGVDPRGNRMPEWPSDPAAQAKLDADVRAAEALIRRPAGVGRIRLA